MNAEAEKANSRKNESNINVDGWDKQEELEELMDHNFQPTVHQLYEDELFPELEFSRKYSENS